MLRIGVVAGQLTAGDPARLDAVEKAFSDRLGIPVEIIRFPSFSALIDAHASARVNYAIHSAISFAAADAACGCVTPLRRPVSESGAVGFRSVLAVRQSATAEIASLRIAYSGEASVSGYQIPRQAMASGSLKAPKLVHAGNIATVVELYLAGKVDGFFAWIPEIAGKSPATGPEDLFGAAYATELGGGEAVRAVWLSEPVFHGPHAVHRSIPDDLSEALAIFLDEMPKTAPGLLDIVDPVHSGGFVAAAHEDYRNLRTLVESAAKR